MKRYKTESRVALIATGSWLNRNKVKTIPPAIINYSLYYIDLIGINHHVNQGCMKQFIVEKFVYNGFCTEPPKGGWGQKTSYTATFHSWTNDPGIALMECSDGIKRLIPICCLMNYKQGDLPKQSTNNMEIFGRPSQS